MHLTNWKFIQITSNMFFTPKILKYPVKAKSRRTFYPYCTDFGFKSFIAIFFRFTSKFVSFAFCFMKNLAYWLLLKKSVCSLVSMLPPVLYVFWFDKSRCLINRRKFGFFPPLGLLLNSVRLMKNDLIEPNVASLETWKPLTTKRFYALFNSFPN